MMNSEIETTIRWDREEKIAHVWTNDSTVMTKLDKKVAEYPDTYKVERVTKDGIFYCCPMDRINFMNPVSAARREANRRNGQNSVFSRRTSKG